MKNNFYLLLVLAALLSSCKKDLVERYENSPKLSVNKAKNTTELKTDVNFTWSTSKSLVINVESNETYPLIITSSNGEVLGKALIFGNKKNEVKLTVGANNEQIKVIFKGKEYPISTGASNINLNVTE
ncbi:MAG: hypothetical protein MH472_06170 [Bacteroidia bacterium]|nr:hypothetical protein [Bacteroidia bacterium]